MKKTIKNLMVAVLVATFTLATPAEYIHAESYPYTDYSIGGGSDAETYVGHTIAVIADGTLGYDKKEAEYRIGKAVSLKVKNPKIAKVKLINIPKNNKSGDKDTDKFVIVTGKKVGRTTATLTYQSGKKRTFDITVYPNHISKSVRVRGKRVYIGEPLAQVKKDFGTKFEIIKGKKSLGKYLVYTDDMARLLIVGIYKDRVFDIKTTSYDWKSGNIGFGVKDPGFANQFYSQQRVFTDYCRVASYIDKYVYNHRFQFPEHSIKSCSTSMKKKPRIYSIYLVETKSRLSQTESTRNKLHKLLEKGLKAAAKHQGFTIQFVAPEDSQF